MISLIIPEPVGSQSARRRRQRIIHDDRPAINLCAQARTTNALESARTYSGSGNLQEKMELLHGYYLEDLKVGMSASYGRTVTETDIANFAGVSGDTNPLHLNAEFAANTRFKQRIAHGMLSAAYISTLIGTRLPGPGCLYISQMLRFTAPVRIGDTVIATATVTDIDTARRRVKLSTVCRVGDTVVVDGEAETLLESRAIKHA
jgi:3-hydroxybutyryl-CoA dehydratase